MAKTPIVVQKPGIAPVALTAAAADGVNGNNFVNNGHTLLIVKNGSASPVTMTVTSVPDPYGRSQDVAAVVAAGAEVAIGPFSQTLFNQTAGAEAGYVDIAWSSATSVTVSAVSV